MDLARAFTSSMGPIFASRNRASRSRNSSAAVTNEEADWCNTLQPGPPCCVRHLGNYSRNYLLGSRANRDRGGKAGWLDAAVGLRGRLGQGAGAVAQHHAGDLGL